MQLGDRHPCDKLNIQLPGRKLLVCIRFPQSSNFADIRKSQFNTHFAHFRWNTDHIATITYRSIAVVGDAQWFWKSSGIADKRRNRVARHGMVPVERDRQLGETKRVARAKIRKTLVA